MGWTAEDTGWRRLWGIILMPLCLFLALSLLSYDWRDIGLLHAPVTHINLIGPVGAWLSFLLFMLIGVGAYLVPLWCLIYGMILFFDRKKKVWPRGAWLAVVMLAIVGLISLRDAAFAHRCTVLNLDHPGGLLGRLFVTAVLERWLSDVGAALCVGSILLVALLMLIEPANIAMAGRKLWAGVVAGAGAVRARQAAQQDRRTQLEREEKRLEKERRRLERAVRRTPEPDDASPEAEPPPENPARRRKRKPKPRVEPAAPAEPQEAPAPEPVAVTTPGAYQLPPLSLLGESPVAQGAPEADTGAVSELLTETLSEFGIECRVTDVETGPVVTRYELLPAPGIRVERIAGLQNNLALALKATSVRVEAPIPGKGVVGVEVPNRTAQAVTLRDVLSNKEWISGKAKVPLVLGKDVGGKVIVADLAAMPHLLIAGATGAGKTVCMNSVLAGLLMSKTPAELRLLLVDPKIVEFAVYNNMPHLVVPVITDPHKVTLGLRWAINEMEKRYKLFAQAGVRNIAAYNSREVAHQEELFGEMDAAPEKPEPPETLPYIVVVIDELADLMLAAQADIENSIARLAQLSRAVGIHMIISTQRPSVNVITGTIKANFPARIAFQVAQRVDSRTILDTVGADKLLGKGDMLFMPPGASKLVRAQGALTTDQDIRNIVDFIKQQGGPDYEMEIKERIEQSKGKDDGGGGGGPGADGEDDELLAQAIEIIRETRRASTSSLQRRLRIGYTRAARVMDILEERGIIGPPRGSEPREILIDLDGDMPDSADEAGGPDDDEYEEVDGES